MTWGTEPASPWPGTFAGGWFWAKGNENPEGSKLRPSPNYLEEFKLGIPPPRVTTGDKFYLSGLSIQQGKHLITNYVLFFSLSCEWPSCPWKAQPLTPFLSSGWHKDLILPFCLWTSCVCGTSNPLLYVGFLHLSNKIWFSSASLFYVNLILRLGRWT